MSRITTPRQDFGASAEILASLDRIDSVEEVVQAAGTQIGRMGVPRMSYHFTPPFHSQTGERTIIYEHGFPPAWIAKYNDPAFRAADPVPGQVMAAVAPMNWRKAYELAPDTAEMRGFKAEAEQYKLLDGVGIPLFGPGGRDAYSAYDLDRPFDMVGDRDLIRAIRETAQAAHLRISHLVIQEMSEGAALSMRETEVLSWVVAGKSGTDIAAILDIAPATVDTYLRRIFAKLDVNDRMKAALRALSLGLVKL